MVKQCLVCNKDFVTYPSKVKIGRGKYCSKECCLKITSITPNKEFMFKKGQVPWNFRGWRYCGRHKNYRQTYIPTHPNADADGYVREHRLVMEKHLGRYLLLTEEIHHIDGNGLNNEIDNLKLMKSKSEHLMLEHKLGTYAGRWTS